MLVCSSAANTLTTTYYKILASKQPESSAPDVLSKLFPQTAVSDAAEVQAEQEKKKKEEEGKNYD